jgi:hypothetical protein
VKETPGDPVVPLTSKAGGAESAINDNQNRDVRDIHSTIVIVHSL